MERVAVRGYGGLHGVQELPADDLVQDIIRIREMVPNFMASCLRQVLDCRPAIVGFTSITQQHVASLALAKRIKAQAPDSFIVFGGANCENVMGAETIRSFPFVDAVVSEEGDVVFPELVRRILVPRQGEDDKLSL